ncbi:MAG: hypothetical protein JWL84_3692 [Rhodospirillales bacterium]|nr:hypothetical protein [Rhodospirillales bacterium]
MTDDREIVSGLLSDHEPRDLGGAFPWMMKALEGIKEHCVHLANSRDWLYRHLRRHCARLYRRSRSQVGAQSQWGFVTNGDLS